MPKSCRKGGLYFALCDTVVLFTSVSAREIEEAFRFGAPVHVVAVARPTEANVLRSVRRFELTVSFLCMSCLFPLYSCGRVVLCLAAKQHLRRRAELCMAGLSILRGCVLARLTVG